MDRHREFTALETIVDLVLRRAIHSVNKTAYTFLEDGEEVGESVSYAELGRRSLGLAAALQRSCTRGDRILLLYPSCIDYMVAFFACLCAGLVAVPLFPPRGTKRSPRLEAIARDCRPRAALTAGRYLTPLRAALAASPELAELEILSSDAPTADASLWRHPGVGRDTVAFLQYTSGSTGAPKGVMVSHGNVIQSETMQQAGMRSDADSDFVTWLPIYHDMGLVGNMLHPFWLGAECVFMAPVAFLQRPARWLRAVSRFRARVSGGPNFAYDLCVDKISEAQRRELDLSGWQVAFNGAEPVRHATLERFVQAFAPHGFARDALFPCYGMAETTLIVSGGAPAEPPVYKCVDKARLARGRVVDAPADEGQMLVSSGRSLPGQTVRIVDPLTRMACPPGVVGEIWLAGAHIASGYWDRPALNAETFKARLIGADDGPFLRTGDLGFLDGDELFITGRIKDVIIVRGANHYPQDIEATAEAADSAIGQAGVAAFGVHDESGERVVVVAEVARTSVRKVEPDALAARIRQQVLEHHEIVVHDVVLIRPRTLPRTSSGKVQRGQCRAQYLANELERLAGDARAVANTA